MKKMVRPISLFLCIMMVSTLWGCTPKTGASSGSKTSSTASIQSSALSTSSANTSSVKSASSTANTSSVKSTSSTAPASQDDNFISDPNNPQIVKKKIIVDMFVPKSPIQPDWNSMTLFKEMEKRTNIHINFEEVDMASYSEKRSLKWEDKKNPPDAFFLCNNMDEVVEDAKSGALTPLNDLISKYAPNYTKWMQQYPEIKRETTLDDGQMYVFASVNTQGGSYSKQYINKTWLDALGLKVPQTIDDFYNVLKAFKTQDPNGKNGNDEIPFSYINSDQSRNFIMSAFGFVGTGIELDPKVNKIVYVPSTNNYRAYLEFMNKLYKEGLLDPYVFSNQSTDLAVKGESDQLGCFASSSAFLIVGNALDKDYTTFGPLTSSVNSTKMWYQYSPQFDPTMMIIPKTSKYSKELVRWIDELYDPNNEALESNGIENVNWKWNDAAKTSWSFLVPSGEDRENYRATLTYQAGSGGALLTTDFYNKCSDPQQQEVIQQGAIYKPYLRTNLPVLHYTSDEMSQINDLEAQFDSFNSTAEANFIKGIKNPNSDADWNDFVSTLNKIGYQKLVSLYQGAYNRYSK